MKDKVLVTVEYVGKVDFTEEAPTEAVLQSIKARAMKQFELDPGSADLYILQYNGADLDDHSHIGDLQKNPVVLKLVLADEVPKG